MANWKDCCKSYGPPRIEAMVSDSPAPDVERITRPASTLARLHAFRGRSTYRLATVAFRVRALRRDFSALLGNEGLRYRRANWLGSRVASILAPTRCHLRGSETRSDERGDTVVEHRRWRYERKSGTARSRQKNPARAMEVRPDTPEGLKPKDLIGMPWRLAFAELLIGFRQREFTRLDSQAEAFSSKERRFRKQKTPSRASRSETAQNSSQMP